MIESVNRFTACPLFQRLGRVNNCILRQHFYSVTRNTISHRHMATVKDSVPHVVRTATDRREREPHATVLSRIEIVNKNIRLLRLSLEDGPARHLPGQYVDLQIPNIETVGGFTITSPPQTAIPVTPGTTKDLEGPYVELAIQRSDKNPPAAYLFRDPAEIINAPMTIRIGGNFTFPPYSLSRAEFEKINKVVFVAGGVGINPIMSMVSALDLLRRARPGAPLPKVEILYSSRREQTDEDGKKVGGEILFEKRLASIAGAWKEVGKALRWTLFETTSEGMGKNVDMGYIRHLYRRMNKEDLFDALGSEENRKTTLVYVCGLPTMTDHYTDLLIKTPGLDEKRVLFEKWW